MLKPQDLVVAIKLTLAREQGPTFEELGSDLRMSSAVVFRAVRRLQQARLVRTDRTANARAVLELLLGGARYVYYAEPGAPTRGVPTAHGAPPLRDLVVGDGEVPVWPDPDGSARGPALEPLHKGVPGAARADPLLYEVLSLFDGIRIGRARERKIAGDEMRSRLEP